MKQPRRYHCPEFKREAVAFVGEQGYSCAATGRSLGVSGVLIVRWKGELEAHEAEAFPCHGHRTTE